jgi:hypothetical protein
VPLKLNDEVRSLQTMRRQALLLVSFTTKRCSRNRSTEV